MHKTNNCMEIISSPLSRVYNNYGVNFEDPQSSLTSPSIYTWFLLPCTELTTDYASPIPNLSFSPSDKTSRRELQRLHFLMEELVVTEENYVTNLKVLGGYYLDTFKIQQYCQPCPIVELQGVVRNLIISHSLLAKQLRYYFINTISNGEQRIVKMANLVCYYGIETVWYSKYIELFYYIRDLILVNNLWFKSWESYLRLIQHKHTDLTFTSLMQKPLARIARYKLYIAAFIEHSTGKEQHLKFAYERCSNLLQIVNNISVSGAGHSWTRSINEMCSYLKILCNFKVILQFFGNCVLFDSAQVIWKSAKRIENRVYGLFLYKQTLILCEPNSRLSRKMKVRFIIRLQNARFYKSLKDTSGGIYTNYEYSSKLEFADDTHRYEILLVAANLQQHENWCRKFADLDQLEHSSTLFLVPREIAPVDMTLAGLKGSLTSSCYFQHLIIVNIYKTSQYDDSSTGCWWLPLLPANLIDSYLNSIKKAYTSSNNALNNPLVDTTQ